MAAVAWAWPVQHGQSSTRSLGLGDCLLHHHVAGFPLQPGLDEPDVHHECHYPVGNPNLYVLARVDRYQDAHCIGLRVSGVMVRPIPLPKHVCPFASRATTERASNRSLSGHAGGGLKTGIVKLLG